MGDFDMCLLNASDKQLHIADDPSEESSALPADETLKSECVGGICPLR